MTDPVQAAFLKSQIEAVRGISQALKASIEEEYIPKHFHAGINFAVLVMENTCDSFQQELDNESV